LRFGRAAGDGGVKEGDGGGGFFVFVVRGDLLLRLGLVVDLLGDAVCRCEKGSEMR
jgi:hypothetical protein